MSRLSWPECRPALEQLLRAYERMTRIVEQHKQFVALELKAGATAVAGPDDDITLWRAFVRGSTPRSAARSTLLYLSSREPSLASSMGVQLSHDAPREVETRAINRCRDLLRRLREKQRTDEMQAEFASIMAASSSAQNDEREGGDESRKRPRMSPAVTDDGVEEEQTGVPAAAASSVAHAIATVTANAVAARGRKPGRRGGATGDAAKAGVTPQELLPLIQMALALGVQPRFKVL